MVRVERSDSFGNGAGASGGEEAMDDESDDEIADEESESTAHLHDPPFLFTFLERSLTSPPLFSLLFLPILSSCSTRPL
jgi:hypothetical protein